MLIGGALRTVGLERDARHSVRRRAAIGVVVLAFASACGGGNDAGAMPATPAQAVAPQSLTTSSLQAPAGCTVTSPPSSCPAVVLQIVGGRTIDGDDRKADEPRTAFALFYDAGGNFLYSTEQRGVIRSGAAFEIDVRTNPAVSTATFSRDFWTVSGGRQVLSGTPPNLIYAFPFPLQITGVQEVAGTTIPAPASWKAALVADGNGRVLFVAQNHGLPPPYGPFPYTIPPGTPRPVTMVLTAGYPESHCGNCWLVFPH